jgi:SRSO17 transposase
VDEAFGAAEGVLIVDQSGVAKCGDKSVGVARPYCGVTGKIDNRQIGVFLAYASRHGHTLLDTRLSLPQEQWTKDAARPEAAGVPAEVVFRTKPQLAAELVLRPGQALRHSWVTFDEGYGKDPGLLGRLEEAGTRYSGAIPQSVRVWLQRPVVEEPGRGVAAGRGASRACGPINRLRRRWSRWRQPCPRAPGNGWPSAKGRKGLSTRSSRVCG